MSASDATMFPQIAKTLTTKCVLVVIMENLDQ